MFKCRETLNVSAVFITRNFTEFLENLVIINAYLAYLNQSLINNTHSKTESLHLIAHTSKNVNTLERCRCSSFGIVKIYFHHRLPLFLLLQSSEHRSICERKVSSQMTFHFHCYFCQMVVFAILRVNPCTQSSGCGRSFQYHSLPTLAPCERFGTNYLDPVSPAIYSLKTFLFKKDESSYALRIPIASRGLCMGKRERVKTGLESQIPSRTNLYGSCLFRVGPVMSKRDTTFLLL